MTAIYCSNTSKFITLNKHMPHKQEHNETIGHHVQNMSVFYQIRVLLLNLDFV